jgi:hypothetical protein
MEVVGKIKVLGQTESVGNNFLKRQLVVTTDEQYAQHISIEFVQDKCDLLDKFQVGQEVKVSINLQGKEWFNPNGEVKYFNSIKGWRIESLSTPQQNLSTPPPVASAPVSTPPPPPAERPKNDLGIPQMQPSDVFSNTDETDDLPF